MRRLELSRAGNNKGLVKNDLMRMIEEYNLKQHVQGATCRTGNILDHILTPDDTVFVNDIHVKDVRLSDHYLVVCKVTKPPIKPPAVKVTFRRWKLLDLN